MNLIIYLSISIYYLFKIMGILHPLVIEAFDWKCPAAAIEINLEPIISKYFNEESYHSYWQLLINYINKLS